MTQGYDFEGDPFGFSARGTGRADAHATQRRGVQNLLLKAVAAWSADDQPRADRLLDQAVAKPFDRHDSVWPAQDAAEGLLFELLTHTVETSEPREWFAAVEATFASLDAEQREHLGAALAPLLHDWDLGRELAGQVRRLVGDRDPLTPPDGDDRLSAPERRAITESILWVAVRLSEELDARGLCAHLRPEHWDTSP